MTAATAEAPARRKRGRRNNETNELSTDAAPPPAQSADDTARYARSADADRQIESKMIRIDAIVRDGSNHRLAGKATSEEIAELAKSLVSDGQLEPIRIYRYPEDHRDQFLLGYGFRRCAAAELNGWTEIRAEVLPVPMKPDGSIDFAEIERARTRENLDRSNLNPMEEAVAVSQLLHAHGGDVVAAAAAIGRSETWIRDRGYLSRLTKGVAELVINGALPLGFAREIAKVGDPHLQEDLADSCKTREDGRNYMGMRELQDRVAQSLRSLKIVPWRLDAQFPKNDRRIVGPCAGCTFNTATDKLLFEHDSKPPEDGLCLNGQCFDAKQKTTAAAVEKVAAKVVKQDRGTGAAVVQEVAEELKIDLAKPTSIARVAGKKAKGEDTTKKKSRSSSVDDYYKSDEYKARQAEYKFNDAKRSWQEKCADQLLNATRKNAARRLMLFLTELLPTMRNWRGSAKELERSWPLAKLIFNEKGYGNPLAKMAAQIKPAAINQISIFRRDDKQTMELLTWIAERWKVEFDEPPKWEDYEYKPAEKKDEKPVAIRRRSNEELDAEDQDDDDEE